MPHGAEEGDLLVVGWGSTLGAIEEAVDQLRAEGQSVASLHLRFMSPLEPGLAQIFKRFRRVMTVEINYSDEPAAPGVEFERRRAQLAQILRERTLVDIDCWSTVRGQPYGPGEIAVAVRRRLPGGDQSMTKGVA